MSANLIYVDLFNGRACKTSGGDALTFPSVVAGGTVSYSLRFLEYINGEFTEKRQDIAALRVGIGPVDARPISGKYRIKLGIGASDIGANTTAFIDAGASATDVMAALNALTDKPCAFTCMDVAGGVLIRRIDGHAQALSVVSNMLVPVSFGRITGVMSGAEWNYELRLTVAPMAFADTAQRVLPDAPSITTLQDGYTDPSNTYRSNEIQALYVPKDFRGTYQLRFGDFAKTRLLDKTDGPTQIEDALNAALLLPDKSRLGVVAVTNPVNNYAHIEFKGDLGGADVDPLVVSVFNAPEGDWTFDLPLDRAEMFFALRESLSIELPFEAEADFYIDRHDHSAGTVTRKLWQTTITVQSPQIMPDMGTIPGVDWLRTNPVDYVPFTANQIVTGPQIYSSVIGTGDADSIVVDHGMDTRQIANIVVRTNSNDYSTLTEGIDYSAQIVSDNEVRLVFQTAPAANSLLVYVQSAPEQRQWDAHTHTQQQIEGLVPLLDNALERVSVLEALLPLAGAAGSTVGAAPKVFFTLPDIGEILADVETLDSAITMASQIIVANTNAGSANTQKAPEGTDVATQKSKEDEAAKKVKEDPDALPANTLYRVVIPGVGKTGKSGAEAVLDKDGTITVPAVPSEPSNPALWPTRSASMVSANRWPILLPAVTDTSVTNAATLPTLSAGVWKCTASAGITLPGGGGRKSQIVALDEYFASDGRAFYKVDRSGDVYFASEMNRELWRVLLGDDQFPEGAVLNVKGELRTRMLLDAFDDDARGIGRVDFGGQYLLRCEAVPVIGTNTIGAASEPALLGQTRVVLSPALETFAWSLSIRREAAGMVSSWMAYRKAQAGEAFSIPAVIRLRLTAFDVDDSSSDPRGQVALIMPSTKLEITI